MGDNIYSNDYPYSVTSGTNATRPTNPGVAIGLSYFHFELSTHTLSPFGGAFGSPQRDNLCYHQSQEQQNNDTIVRCNGTILALYGAKLAHFGTLCQPKMQTFPLKMAQNGMAWHKKFSCINGTRTCK